MEATMKMKATSTLAACLLAGAVAVGEAVVIPPVAEAFPAYFFKFRKTRLPFSACPQDAHRTVRALGLQNAGFDPFGAGGTTPTVRGVILCIRLPGAGPCRGQDGATVVFNSAGDNDADAKSILDRMDREFGDGVLIDCG
jgi:hypothetical protein